MFAAVAPNEGLKSTALHNSFSQTGFSFSEFILIAY
jgi:hypothetical protein